MTEAAGEADVSGRVLAVLDCLMSVASPRGHEGALAAYLARRLSEEHSPIRWTATVDADGSGSLLGTPVSHEPGDDLLVVSHLDTSLSGDPLVDSPATGRHVAPTGLVHDRETGHISGGGMLVAKAPAAAAVVAFVRAADRALEAGRPLRARLLLSSRGTHRAPDWSFRDPAAVPETGVEQFLRTQPHPRAAVIAKAGPPGVLWDEPGCCYFRVRVRGPWAPVLMRAELAPDGGLVLHASQIAAHVDAWGVTTAAGFDPGEQSGSVFGVGAIRAGLPDKPDLLPGGLELYAYLVHPGTADAEALAADLQRHVRAALAGGPLSRYEVDVIGRTVASGQCSSADSPVIRVARSAWEHVHAAPLPAILAWTGSTDGVVLRAHGIPTARTGPAAAASADGVNDRMELADLLRAQAVYERMLDDVSEIVQEQEGD